MGVAVGEQRGEEVAPGTDRTGTGGVADGIDRVRDIADGQDRLAVVPGVEVAQCRPTDTDAALRRVADEVSGCRDDLVGRDACKQ